MKASELDDYDLFCGPGWPVPRHQFNLDSMHPAELARFARSAIDHLQERLLPRCDARCRAGHDRAYFVGASMQIERTGLGPKDWWSDPTVLERPRPWRWLRQGQPTGWIAVSFGAGLPAGTRLTKLTETDRYWVTHDSRPEHTLFRIESGKPRGDILMATTFGPSELPDAAAGALIVPDHPPVRDHGVVARLLDYASEIQVRGTRYEEAGRLAGPSPRQVAAWRSALDWMSDGDPAARAAYLERLDPNTRRAILDAPAEDSPTI